MLILGEGEVEWYTEDRVTLAAPPTPTFPTEPKRGTDAPNPEKHQRLGMLGTLERQNVRVRDIPHHVYALLY